METCVLAVYDDGFGNKTAGWGHKSASLPPVNTPISQAQADQWFELDWDNAAHVVTLWVTAALTFNQKDALTDFVFNVGVGAPGKKDGFVWLKNPTPPTHSTLLVLLNAGDTLAAVKELHKWCNVNGTPCVGLKKRRLQEAVIFSSPSTIK